MKKIVFNHISSVILIIVISLLNYNICLSGSASSKFIDLDGNGINDNLTDIDNNNIPDDFQNDIDIKLPISTVQFTVFSNNPSNQTITSQKIKSSDNFQSKIFVTRHISVNRCDFDAEFNTRLGAAAASGGACAGGICF